MIDAASSGTAPDCNGIMTRCESSSPATFESVTGGDRVLTALIATGGTIAWRPNADRLLTGEELLERSRSHADLVDNPTSVPSWNLSVDDMVALASRVRELIDAGYDGVVVTHGTDTMEESAWLTELLLGAAARARAAVAFTGAMVGAGEPGSDGEANLRSALAYVRDPAQRGRGVVVVFGDAVLPARSVHKFSATEIQPYRAWTTDVGGVPPEPGDRVESNVAHVKVGPVARPPLPRQVAGLVVEGVGETHIPGQYHDEIEERAAREGLPIVIASRAAGTLAQNLDDEVLLAGDLTAEKATLALMVGLGAASGLDDLRLWWRRLFEAS